MPTPAFQHADAVAAEAADHRPAGAGAEVGRGDPRLLRERLAEGRRQAQCQLVAGEHGGRLGDLALAARLGAGGDHDLLAVHGEVEGESDLGGAAGSHAHPLDRGADPRALRLGR